MLAFCSVSDAGTLTKQQRIPLVPFERGSFTTHSFPTLPWYPWDASPMTAVGFLPVSLGQACWKEFHPMGSPPWFSQPPYSAPEPG